MNASLYRLECHTYEFFVVKVTENAVGRLNYIHMLGQFLTYVNKTTFASQVATNEGRHYVVGCRKLLEYLRCPFGDFISFVRIY